MTCPLVTTFCSVQCVLALPQLGIERVRGEQFGDLGLDGSQRGLVLEVSDRLANELANALSLILWNDEELTKRMNSAVFPGSQGGPLEHVIAGKAVAFGEALQPSFTTYIEGVCANAKALGRGMESKGLRMVTGGTDNHLLLVDLTTAGEDVTGKLAENALDEVGITVNKNTIPGEKRSPFVTSGIRVGSAAMTTRGFNEAEAERIGELIGETVTHLSDETTLAAVKAEVAELLAAHALYPELG